MGFKAAKHQVLQCLKEGRFSHEQRNSIDIKNLLATGELSPQYVIGILRGAGGENHQCSPHHLDKTIDVHIVKTRKKGKEWYIKWYFLEPNSVFISVHN